MSERRFAPVVILVSLVVIAGCTGVSTTAGTDSSAGDASATLTSTAGDATQGSIEIHFINVGQSVSTLVVGPTGETMLIDTGHFTDDGEYVLQYLRAHNIDRIDYLVTSHNDADHIGGNAAIINYYETEADGIGAVYDPGIAASTDTYAEYLDAIEEHNVTLYETREGDSIPFEGIEVRVLGPPEPYLDNDARNENSIVLKLTYGQTSFLFPGDAEDDQEAYLVEEYGSALDSTVLKAGHHGSKSSSTGAFLDAVNPQAVIVSSGYDNQYGHPHQAVLERLADRSLRTYWTATHGTIVLVSDGTEVEVRTQRKAPTDPLSLRDAPGIQTGTTNGVQPRVVLTGETVSTPIRTDGGTHTSTAGDAATDSALVVAEIHEDADGDDRSNLNDEYIVLRNDGETSLDLSGWTVRDEADHTYTFPDGFTLAPGDSVTLHTGSGTDSETDLYWGAGSPIWNNAGDTIIITNSTGTVVIEVSY
jgi:competence protein ComEC